MGELIRVAGVSEIAPGEAKAFEIGSKTVCVVNLDGEFYAFDEYCTHAGAPLSEGTFYDGKVECPWHCAEFDVKTGEALSPPAPCGVQCHKAAVEGDDIKIELAE